LLIIICFQSLYCLYIAESDSAPSVNNHAAASANPRASNKGRGKGGPGIVKTEGVHFIFSPKIPIDITQCRFFDETYVFNFLVLLPLTDSPMDKDFGGNKPKSSGNGGPSLVELSGYNAKRQEFDPEYDNDAEQLLAEMEFKDTDTEEEREIKLRVLRIYYKR
jgi:transcriptional adapter 2-alpha